MTINNNLELLSPAGDIERFQAAVNFGANAVYLGRKTFGMRSSPLNFDFEQLSSAVKQAHQKNVKVSGSSQIASSNCSLETI